MLSRIRHEQGDTLIEVTFALAILAFVLLGSTAIAAAAFRTGQTARERTQVSEVAQAQLEALRSFRDNHTWAEFEQGHPPAYGGVDAVQAGFHMELSAGEWRPVAGPLTSTTNTTLVPVGLTVPTATMTLATSTPAAERVCGYDFLLKYSFTPLGGSQLASNQITTRLANLKYDPNGAPVSCP
jgi:type II secretory pathway pseudopilin PulG